MSSSSNRSKPPDAAGGPECGNPYTILGLQLGVSDASIAKSYRKLALKLHPDKQKQRRNQDNKPLTQTETDALAKQFHDVKEARSFLLDSEHAEARRKYDARLKSTQARRVEDEKRERHMSDRRRRMREELAARERQHGGTASSAAGGGGSGAHNDDELVEQLRRKGRQMRETYETKTATEEAAHRAKAKTDTTDRLQQRQVRVKWSRSKVDKSHSEHTLAELLSASFGRVEEVELLGSKGNAALITFANVSSCRPCVEAYADSDTIRATFVGKRKDEEKAKLSSTSAMPSGAPSLTRSRDGENLEERKLRQAAEREKMLRQMELDEEAGAGGFERKPEGLDACVGGDTTKPTMEQGRHTSSAKQSPTSRPSWAGEYPPQFPITAEHRGLTALERLERVEREVLGKVLEPDTLRKIQIK